jgi:hypothetical protein
MTAELDGQDLGVDRGRVHDADVDETNGFLVEAGLDHRVKNPGWAPMRTRACRVTV